MPRIGKPRRGANALEFALTMPLFAILVFSVVDYGWYFMNRAMADIAVFRGCRQGSIVDPNVGSPQVSAIATMEPFMQVVGQECSGVCDAGDIGVVPFRRLTCSVEFDFTALTGFTPVPDRVGSATVSRLEWQRAR